MKSGVTTTKDELEKITKMVKALGRRQVLVGVPSSTTRRDPEPGEPADINNATIGYLMENGSPANNIPARPHLVPGVENVLDKVALALGQAAKLAMSGGSEEKIEANLEIAGQKARDGVKNKISSGPFTPLKEDMIKARKRRGRTGEKPLIDTTQYQNSITYVLRKKV